jgi:hypothetical protein
MSGSYPPLRLLSSGRLEESLATEAPEILHPPIELGRRQNCRVKKHRK